MPMMGYRPPRFRGRAKKLEFWIRSSRGTDQKEVIRVPASWSKADIKNELEQWCSQFGCWEASESMMRYGYRPAR